jgi:nitrate reductase NapE component
LGMWRTSQTSEVRPSLPMPARPSIGCEGRDARVFFCFLVVGMVPPMSLFLHAALSTYSMVLVHLHPNALITLAIFQYLCEAFVGVHSLVVLFCLLRGTPGHQWRHFWLPFLPSSPKHGDALHPHAEQRVGGVAGEPVFHEV